MKSPAVTNVEKNTQLWQQINPRISEVENTNTLKVHSSLIETPLNTGMIFKSFKMESSGSNKNEVVDLSKKIQAWTSWKEKHKQGIDGISEINWCRSGRQINNFHFRRDGKNSVLKKIAFERR